MNGEEAEAWYSSSGREPDRIAEHRGARVVRLAEADATLDDKVPALRAAITALVDAARGDDAALS